MIYCFEGASADDVWEKATTAITDQGTGLDSRGGSSRELLHVALQVSDPRQRWVSRRRESMNVAFAIAEVIWILGGRNDSAFLNYFNRQLPKFAGTGPIYDGAYGERLRTRFDVDQVRTAALSLQANPTSRQVVLSIWDPKTDLPHQDGIPRSTDVPCNVTSMLKVRNGKLDWTQVMRSNDVYLGLPHNLVQFTMIQEVVAGWADLGLGTYSHWSDSLHIYDRNATETPTRFSAQELPKNTDNLSISLSKFDDFWPEVEAIANMVTDPSVEGDALERRLDQAGIPEAWENPLRILIAEGRRRRGERPDVTIKGLSNPVLSELWRLWLARLAS